MNAATHHPTPTQTASPGEQNLDRTMVRLVTDAAARLGVRVEPLGQGWILRLVRPASKHSPEKVRHIHGYSFDLNPAATHEICCDKAATAQVLGSAGVPCVPHTLVLHPEMARYVPMRGSWPTLLAAWEVWAGDIVVKENTGTGGRGVTRCKTIVELEQAVYRLFARTLSIAACPFVEISHEYRFVILRGVCEVAYEKIRASVTGDGVLSVVELLCAQKALPRAALGALLEHLDEHERRALADVPIAGEKRLLNWRHNLGQGATAVLLDASDSTLAPALRIAQDAAQRLGLVFGSVDVVRSAGQLRVLEVNAGVMMEFLARTQATGENIARRVYENAVAAMFDV